MSLRGGFDTLIWMKKPVILISFIVFLLVSFLYVFASNDGFRVCDLEVDKVCYDEKLNQYQIEENANILFAVTSVEYGEAVLQLWNEIHPNQANIQYVLVEEALSPDLIYQSSNEMALIYEKLFPLDENLEISRPDLAHELNINGNRFNPIVGEGFAFITHKTELERLIGPWQDTNLNNIHDTLESFESIMTVQESWETDSIKLVLSLSEPYSLYPYLTADAWSMFDNDQSYYPGFEKESFLSSLEFIQKLSEVNWNQSENNIAESYTWDYPSVLYNDNFIFSQVSTWMFYEEMDMRHESEWVISAFPKAYESSDTSLSPLLTNVFGYSIDANTLYPSAAHELMRIMYSVDGLQKKIDTDKDVLLVNKDILDQLNFNSEHKKQFTYAFLTSQSEPLIAVEDYPSERAIRLYYEIDLEQTIRKLWNKEINVQEAQIEIALKSDDWIMQHTKMFEGRLKNE